MDKQLKEFADSLLIDQIGIAPARVYNEIRDKLYAAPFCERYTIEERINPFLILPSAKSVIVYLIPYYDGKTPEHNISRYAWGRDYHEVAKEISFKIERYLKNRFDYYEGVCACDITPLAQKHLAYLAGLGFFGDNHLLINETYGTYFFIAHILTNIPFECDVPKKKECMHCGKCKEACKMRVLQNTPANFYECASAITQKKSPLNSKEENVFKELIWGCDKCQEVCPYNKNALLSPILSYFGKPIFNYSEEAEFPKDRAYSYKRKKFMQRNLELHLKLGSHEPKDET